jgi:hypothetical protein
MLQDMEILNELREKKKLFQKALMAAILSQ